MIAHTTVHADTISYHMYGHFCSSLYVSCHDNFECHVYLSRDCVQFSTAPGDVVMEAMLAPSNRCKWFAGYLELQLVKNVAEWRRYVSCIAYLTVMYCGCDSVLTV